MTLKSGILVCTGLAVWVTVSSAPFAQAPAASKQPQFTMLKADFVPGEKTIFFDDFTDMTAGDPPLHFKSRGAAPELRAAGELRQLTVVQNGTLYPNLTALPANFTYEADVKFDVPQGIARIFLVLYSKEREAAAWSTFVRTNAMDITVSRKLPKYEELGRSPVKVSIAQPVKMALWIQNGRLRIFMNGDKLIDANQVDLPPIDKVEIRTEISGTGPAVGFRSVRFAESTADFSQAIAASGRYVTHGILFDTDSDRLKPESAYAIQSVAKGLAASPDLKLLVEGHTDGSGNAAHNMDLSKRRAEAVKSVLVSQFNIDAARLTTSGLGATKPLDSNDTPQGRAQNRRVEFAKQ